MTHGLVGKKIKYRYGNGWQYHACYESEQKISYKVVSGPYKIMQLHESGPDAPREIFFETGEIFAVEEIG